MDFSPPLFPQGCPAKTFFFADSLTSSLMQLVLDPQTGGWVTIDHTKTKGGAHPTTFLRPTSATPAFLPSGPVCYMPPALLF